MVSAPSLFVLLLQVFLEAMATSTITKTGLENWILDIVIAIWNEPEENPIAPFEGRSNWSLESFSSLSLSLVSEH